MPGDRLLLLARRWFDAGTAERVFEPLLADSQRECAELSGRPRMVCRVKGVAAFATAFVVTFASTWWRPTPAGLERSVWRAAAAFTLCGTLLTLLPSLNDVFLDGRWFRRVELLIPSALVLTIPMAVVPTVILVLRDPRWHPADARRSAVRFAAISTLFVLVFGGWVTPAANQQWRSEVSQQQGYYRNGPVLRGSRELTLFELAGASGPADVLVVPHDRDREFHNRLIVIVTPMVMTMLAFGVAGRPRRSLASAIGWWISAVVFYVLYGYAHAVARMTHTPAETLWLMPVTIALLAAVLHVAPNRRAMRTSV